MTEDRLRQWLEEERLVLERMRAGGGASAAADPAAFADKPGIALFDAMFDGRMPGPPIGKTLDFILIAVRPGEAVFQGQPLARHYNPLGSVHGGWFATLLDSALGCAVHSMMPAGKAYTTLELKVNMIRSLSERVPRVRAEGRTLHVGAQTAIAEARLVGPDDRLYAHATTTCLVFDARTGAARVRGDQRQADG
ncbi:MAG: PaaI family thioesterase [Burkholderiaceae bacterium]|nr:PaaI family thioesterase [Burkholderiaceae bacterium]